MVSCRAHNPKIAGGLRHKQTQRSQKSMNSITDPAAQHHLRRTIDQSMLDRVLIERDRQDKKFGPQQHPDGTGLPGDTEASDIARQECNYAFANGYGTWRAILCEEYAEAMAETDPANLQKELLEVAAVAVAWAGDLESRILGLNIGPTPKQREAHQEIAKAEALAN